MAKRKVLKSVVRSVADSFTSNMNYRDGDYVMGHLLNAARAARQPAMEIDLLAGKAEPAVLATAPVSAAVREYSQDFPGLVTASGSDPKFVKAARLRIEFDLDIEQPVRGDSRYRASPFVCTAEIDDDRGKRYEVTLHGLEYSEKPSAPSKRGSVLGRVASAARRLTRR